MRDVLEMCRECGKCVTHVQGSFVDCVWNVLGMLQMDFF